MSNETPTDYDDSGDDMIDAREKPMGFFDHMEELRWTVVKCAIAFTVFATLIGIFLQQFNDALLWPLHTVQGEYPKMVIDLGTTSIMEGFSVVVQMCCMGGLVMAAPFMLVFVGQFVAPALTTREMKLVLPVSLSAFVLFLMGAAFSFFLLVPSTLRVSVELNELFGFQMRWTPGSYYSLLLWLVLGVGASFEFPLVLVLAVYMGLLSVERLRRSRKIMIVVFFIVAAVVTPTPDPVTQTMFAVPLYILYELAIIVASRVSKRRVE